MENSNENSQQLGHPNNGIPIVPTSSSTDKNKLTSINNQGNTANSNSTEGNLGAVAVNEVNLANNHNIHSSQSSETSDTYWDHTLLYGSLEDTLIEAPNNAVEKKSDIIPVLSPPGFDASVIDFSHKKRKIRESSKWDRELSLSDPCLNVPSSSTPIPKDGREGIWKKCLECGSTTRSDCCAIWCKFCSNPVCGACSAVPTQIISALDPSYLENYIYACSKCKNVVTKSSSENRLNSGVNIDGLRERMDKLTVQMGSLTQILGKVESNFTSLLSAIESKVDSRTSRISLHLFLIDATGQVGRDTSGYMV